MVWEKINIIDESLNIFQKKSEKIKLKNPQYRIKR